MALKDDITNLPTTVGEGNTGHLNNHQTIHAALKDHEGRLPVIDTTYGQRIILDGKTIWGDTGWVDVTSMLSPAPSSGTMKVRRTAGWLLISCGYLVYSPGVTASLTLPAPWRTQLNDSFTMLNSSGTSTGYGRLTYEGVLSLTSTSNTSASSILKFPMGTNPQWPAAAPTA